MPAITLAGENLIAHKQSLSQNLVIDKMVFANIPALDDTAPVNRSEGLPNASYVSGVMDITQANAINGNTVVYSTVLASTVGTWSFNWMGLYSSADDTIVAIAYVPVQEKRATVGQVLGNVFTKNFAIEFNAASDTTGIVIDAQSWQIDYTARLDAIGELDRSVVEKTIGNGLYVGNAFLPKYENNQWKISAGHAIARGLYLTLEHDAVFVPGALPKTVWIDLYQEKTLASIETKIDIVTGEGRVDYVVDGVQHYLVPLASLASTSNITDLRASTGDTLEVFHRGNLKPATTNNVGYSQLNSATNSNREDQAATPKAIKTVMDIAQTEATTLTKGRVKLTASKTSVSESMAPTAKALKETYDYRVPSGGIIMWSGAIASIPTGWKLCDGASGTPDLRDRFIVGAGGSLNPSATGGALAKTTTSAGAHSHTITVNSHTLSVAQMPSHNHGGSASWGAAGTNAGGFMSHGGGRRTNYVSSSGSNGSHSHSASSKSTGAHTHSIADVRPPYYALAFIMKT